MLLVKGRGVKMWNSSFHIKNGCDRGGGLRFGLVGDVPPAAGDPYPRSGVVFPKKGTHV